MTTTRDLHHRIIGFGMALACWVPIIAAIQAIR